MNLKLFTCNLLHSLMIWQLSLRFACVGFIYYITVLILVAYEMNTSNVMWAWISISFVGILSLIIYCSTVMATWSFQILGCVSLWAVIAFQILVRMKMQVEEIRNPPLRVISILIFLQHQNEPSRNSYCTGKRTGECWYVLSFLYLLMLWVASVG